MFPPPESLETLKILTVPTDPSDVASNPFEAVPSSVFVKRMLAPSLGVLAISFAVMGSFATSPLVHRLERSPATLGEPRPPIQAEPVQAAVQQWRRASDYFAEVPAACISGNTPSQFQAQQCSEHWQRLGYMSAVAALPILAWLLFWVFAWDEFNRFYRRSHRTIGRGQAALKGRVTSPAVAPGNLFSWLFCLTVVAVELPSGQQIRAHLPVGEVVPQPGKPVVLFSVGKRFGEERYLAVFYAPNLVVMRGVRS